MLVAGQRLEKLARSRLGDGANILDHLAACHTDTIVGDGNRAGILIIGHVDDQLGIIFEQRRVGKRGKTQAVNGVRRV